jgi:ubiquitin-protein ligase
LTRLDYSFADPNVLSEFYLTIAPNEDSYWKDGKFKFEVSVPEEYNMQVIEIFKNDGV